MPDFVLLRLQRQALPFDGLRRKAWRAAAALLLLLAAGLCAGLSAARAQAPPVAYRGPIEITRGGTYTGNFRSLDPNVPCVKVRTADSVVLVNCVFAGFGPLVYADSTAHHITVRNCRGYGLAPTADNQHRGRFLTVMNARSIRVENNYLEHTSGIFLQNWSGNGTAANTLTVVGNKVKNIDGRYRNGGGGAVSFLFLNEVRGLVGAEVAWNQIVNDPDSSFVEDNINFYNSGGTPTSAVLVHDNYIYGGFPPDDPTTQDHTGSGIICDGSDSTAAGATQYIVAEHNVVVCTSNAGMNIAAGHHITYRHNRIVNSGSARIRGVTVPLRAPYSGLSAWLNDSSQAAFFGNHTVEGNIIGYMNYGGYRRDVDVDSTNRHQVDPALQIALPDPITLQTEANEWALWVQRLDRMARKIGPDTTNPTFYRAVNLHGAALPALDGHPWESGEAPNFALLGPVGTNGSVAFSPRVCAARESVLRSRVKGSTVTCVLTHVPNGQYTVWFYTWAEDAGRIYSAKVNGVLAAARTESGSAGTWYRRVARNISVRDNRIKLTTSGGICVAGIEAYAITAAPQDTAGTVSRPTLLSPADGPAVLPPVVYPNPADATVVLEAPAATQAFLYDGRGILVRRFAVTSAQQPLDVRSLPAGFYHLRLLNADKPVGSCRVLIQH
ncbi:hypothetical protein GCM10027048_04980 [Hymenobacter coalescens]